MCQPPRSVGQTSFAAEHTAAAGLYRANLSDATRNWQCALLDRSAAPSDAAHSAADNTQTLLDPVCYLSRIFPTGEYTCKKSHCVPIKERKVDQGILSPLSVLSPQRCCRSSPWRDTWFPLSKRRSSFVNGFGFFFLAKVSSLSAWLYSIETE